MPTTKQRINITVDSDMGWALKQLSKDSQVPLATIAAKLIKLGVEAQKDSIWNKIKSQRLDESKHIK